MGPFHRKSDPGRGGLWLLAAALWASCSAPPPDGALLALVDFAPDTTARCLRVVVRTADGAEVRSSPVATDRKRPARIGIAKNGLPEEVLVYALGFSDAACATATVPLERTEDGAATFAPARASTVTLKLTRRPNARDDDGDGYPSIGSGGDDCDDTAPSIHPGAPEICGDKRDNDCDRAVDCEELACANRACGPITGASCQPPGCAERLCSDDADNDGDTRRDCADSDCAGAACRNGGTCQAGACKNAVSEKELCADLADNDGDQKIDCADPDCAGSLCDPGDACLRGARCDNALTCAGGLPVSCTSPPTSCLKGTGRCDPSDGRCIYPPDPGTPCSDQNSCTSFDQCTDAGTCVGAPKLCLAPAACLRPAGCAPDAGCTFVPAAAGPCDDADPCTLGDSCRADAGCAGTPVSCTPGACQLFANQCSDDGGCVFGARDAGAACDGGVCNGAGGCIPFFPFPPSNFTESLLPTPGPPTSLDCAVVLESELADGGVGFDGWCGNPAPPFRVVPQPGGVGDALLLSFSDLKLGLDASVELRGARPVIFASAGNLEISGALVTSAGTAACADGGAGGAVAGDKGAGGGGFGSAGAAGGKSGAAGGVANGEPRLTPLRGGCPGGGNAAGGGAVQLSAAGNLSVTGTIAAPGRGGPAAPASNNGGNGAGSGGGLLLEGLFVLVGPTGALTANGGAGGEGSDLIFEGQGGASGELHSADVAQGGSSLNGGGRGGDGAAGTTAATAGAGSTFNAGGGGGAGIGRVRINAVNGCSLGTTSVLSPRPTSNQDAGCT